MLQTEYLTEYVMVKQMSDNLIKVIKFNYPFRQTGFEKEKKVKPVRGINEHKLQESISRSKKIIYEYALCNEFDFFCTFTLDKEKYDRENLKLFIKDLGQFIRDYRKKYNVAIQYLFIPELHNDKKSWHIHGLIKGLKMEHLKELNLDMILPYKILNELKKGNIIYDFPLYSERFGYCTLSPIKNIEHCAIYITKYISKDLAQNIDFNNKCYYCSKGLKKAEVIKKGTLLVNVPSNFWQFENDYVSIKTFNANYENLDSVKSFLDSIINDV